MPADETLPDSAHNDVDVIVGGFGAAVPAEVAGVGASAEVSPAAAKAKRRLGWFFWVCAGWLILIVFGAIFAPLLPLQPPNVTPPGAVPFELPSIHHLLGTDTLGRDLFSRVVYGARVSLVVGFGSIAIGVLVGGLMGLIAGYVRGKTDTILSAIANVALAFPALILLLAVVAFLGQDLLYITLAVGVLSIAPIFRVVRGTTVSFADLEFVTAANGVGATRRRVLFREILPNVVPIVISYSLVFVAVSILAEAALSFLALSVPLPTATWGGIVAEGKTYLSNDPFICLWPSIALFLTVLSLNFVGDRLRALFDVREAKL
ncbi:peptide/nickel transport system permease protein [Antricoccus suffuscus]|uniref:Peptide/nickel transport system permease protein n=1 Tax=Antricoccus suffuscus TaxID=1629062 RepID=A0A2T1A5N0_9ACTN|nr:ABC transporter permease [Antricoccus suffuscus]PRZ43913.1 peptide/nickel transport system permease protein [Antricoccus suffuscus]